MDNDIITSNTKESSHSYSWLYGVLLFLTISCSIALGIIIYIQQEDMTVLEIEKAELNEQLSSVQSELESAHTTLEEKLITIQNVENAYVSLEDELAHTRRALRQEERQVDMFRDQLLEITGTVGALDKLSRIDRELLRKYSRTSFLNENYRPAQLTQIPDRWVLEGRQDQYFLPEAWPFLERMLRSADRDGIELRVLSAFRSFDEQRDLHGQFQQQFGSGANRFSADQGFSEHQLGTTVDIVDIETAATSQVFAETEAYRWLERNAHRFGFILSYPEGNEYYIFEPWHWRFVGVDLATDLYRENAYFYDWDQRRIDEYLIKIFD